MSKEPFGYGQAEPEKLEKNEIAAVQAELKHLPKINSSQPTSKKKKVGRKYIKIPFDMNDREEKELYEAINSYRYDKRNHKVMSLLAKYWGKKEVNHEEVIHNLSKFISTVNHVGVVSQQKTVYESPPNNARPVERSEGGFVKSIDISKVEITESPKPKAEVQEENLDELLGQVFTKSQVFSKSPS